ncbi:hypothetical protein TNCT_165611 [Trichonephila clavata]|uniref:Uncharacterized protein n=1 Tax=Trichonephila clavata TaxID=2740835 RepID=A0A8X6GRE1_TRICU|nr:hypothetical protein TNCT_165611 [Trichonephila clavata]
MHICNEPDSRVKHMKNQNLIREAEKEIETPLNGFKNRKFEYLIFQSDTQEHSSTEHHKIMQKRFRIKEELLLQDMYILSSLLCNQWPPTDIETSKKKRRHRCLGKRTWKKNVLKSCSNPQCSDKGVSGGTEARFTQGVKAFPLC